MICLVRALALEWSNCQVAQAEETTPSSISVHIERGLTSVDARNAPLGEILETIAKQASFQLDTKGDLDIPVTWSFADVLESPFMANSGLSGHLHATSAYHPASDILGEARNVSR